MRVTRLCSFFSAARRTNQEAPPLLSGYLARRLAPPSGAAELAALKQSSPLFLNRLASSRPDKGGGIATLHRKCPGHFAVRYPKIYRPISSFRATTRNPEIPGHGITQDARTVRHYSTHCHLQKLDPASGAGDTVMFILLCSEKNEPRSAAAVIGLSRSEAGTALGGCGTRCAQTVLALIPQPAGLLPAR